MKYAMDVEVFQNFFSVVCINIDDQLDIQTFVIFEDIDQRQQLVEFLQQNHTLIGYNSLYYDNVILSAIIQNYNLDQLYGLSQTIISGSNEEIRRSLQRNFQNLSIDLMKIMAFDSMGIGLKQVAINLQFPRIQDLPLPYDSIIKRDQIDLILDYNVNDVLITLNLYKTITEEIQLREEVGKLFGVNLSNTSRSRMANRLLETIYSRKTGLDSSRFKESKTYRDVVPIKWCIGKNIQFSSNILQSMLTDMEKLVLIESHKYRFKKSVSYAGKIFDIGVGGLHTRDDSNIFKSDNKHSIIDADVDSFYPRIMLLNKIKPQHLDGQFLEILETITEDRLQAKISGDKIKADALKITINSIFGKLGSDVFWLYDPKAFYSVTISGQLYLLMLVEYLHKAGFKILSANTDGVISQVPNNKISEYYEVCDQWMNQTGFTLSYDQYKQYIRRDVNNYMAQDMKGKVKTKGLFEIHSRLGKSFKHPIIPKALHAYFLDQIPIDKTIKTSDNIHDYLWTQKINKKFDVVFRKNGSSEKQQRTNRFYACIDGGHLYKIDNIRELIVTNSLVKILNDVDANCSICDYKIDYDYYIRETQKWVTMIEPSVQNVVLF